MRASSIDYGINNGVNFGNLSKLSKPLEAFYNKNSVVPILLIETGVTLGRTYEANKTGGKKEAIERFVEQGVSALIWLFGVQGLRKAGDFLANLLKIEKNQKFSDINTLSSLAIATVFIGFVLPKINHFISSKLTQKDKNNTIAKDTNFKPQSLDEFKKKTYNSPSFGSLSAVANLMETNSTARLFITDIGVIGGRFKNGRNKYERIEGLFRDISSIFFYLFSTKLIVKALNKITNNVDIAPSALEKMIQDEKNGIKTVFEDKNAVEFMSKLGNKDIEQFANSTIRKNFAFYSIGTLISTFALAILIPKVQYFIRSKLTDKSQFPGDDNYASAK